MRWACRVLEHAKASGRLTAATTTIRVRANAPLAAATTTTTMWERMRALGWLAAVRRLKMRVHLIRDEPTTTTTNAAAKREETTNERKQADNSRHRLAENALKALGVEVFCANLTVCMYSAVSL